MTKAIFCAGARWLGEALRSGRGAEPSSGAKYLPVGTCRVWRKAGGWSIAGPRLGLGASTCCGQTSKHQRCQGALNFIPFSSSWIL